MGRCNDIFAKVVLERWLAVRAIREDRRVGKDVEMIVSRLLSRRRGCRSEHSDKHSGLETPGLCLLSVLPDNGHEL